MKHSELIKACQSNNLKAQMELYLMYKDMLYNVSLRIVNNKQDTQDIVHDAFIKAFQNISRLDNDLNIGAWLKRIVINASLDFLRKQKKIGSLYESSELIDEEEGESEEFENNTLNIEEVKKAINKLKSKYKIIIVLYLIEGYTHKEISQQLGLKESTVRNQYIRGKRLLKLELKNTLII